ncbi:MAG: hypothetical protein QOK16_1097 [Solirubrobacteraceae bacterium]|jgi:hypothetical protein|nr:hypothetical protein [Solirubrobacteraceae bacterium]MEA2186086.1 hypothetical protein [Solirubrobacteraceae bacterium]
MGQPFVIGRDGTRQEVIERYERWLDTQPELLAALPELTGRTPGCWCAPQACHGDVLARLANTKRQRQRHAARWPLANPIAESALACLRIGRTPGVSKRDTNTIK